MDHHPLKTTTLSCDTNGYDSDGSGDTSLQRSYDRHAHAMNSVLLLNYWSRIGGEDVPMLSYCLNTTNMEWRKAVVDHHVMNIIAFVLWGDETYNNQPQKLQHTNKQYWYITWSVEQLFTLLRWVGLEYIGRIWEYNVQWRGGNYIQWKEEWSLHLVVYIMYL